MSDQLETIQLKVRQELSEVALKDKRFNLEVLVNDLVGTITLELTTLFSCETIPTPSFKYPKDWWNHFKQDKMPKWFIKKFPIEYICKDIDLKYVYEAFNPSSLKDGSTVLVRGLHD
ncbi:MAG: hypothetical protein QM489_01130 [Candidatus Izemoplasma sp.]